MSVATDLTIVRAYCSRTDSQTLRLADALVRLSTAGQSVRDIVTAVADTAAPLGRNRIAVIVKTRKANPDADADQFAAALREATAANTGARKAPAVTTDDTVSPEGTTAAAAPVTVAAPTVTIPTLDSLTDALAVLMAAAREHLSAADLARFCTSVDAELWATMPAAPAVSLPVAV